MFIAKEILGNYHRIWLVLHNLHFGVCGLSIICLLVPCVVPPTILDDTENSGSKDIVAMVPNASTENVGQEVLEHVPSTDGASLHMDSASDRQVGDEVHRVICPLISTMVFRTGSSSFEPDFFGSGQFCQYQLVTCVSLLEVQKRTWSELS
ncbi:UNVERIFIED_CONTAM: hypothetical protein K2H54_060976 [Gekko kuhli]